MAASTVAIVIEPLLGALTDSICRSVISRESDVCAAASFCAIRLTSSSLTSLYLLSSSGERAFQGPASASALASALATEYDGGGGESKLYLSVIACVTAATTSGLADSFAELPSEAPNFFISIWTFSGVAGPGGILFEVE